MTNASRRPIDLRGGEEIRIIGPRRSGKTTFMAALARYPNAREGSPIQSIDPADSSAGRLIAMARDILEDGRELAGTDYTTFATLPTYTLLITLKPSFQKRPIAALKQRTVRLQLSCREYAGEIMHDLRSNHRTDDLDDYLKDCANASGLLLLLDGSAKTDRLDAAALKILQNKLLLARNAAQRTYRIAIVFAKCEQSETWIYRHNILDFIQRKFPAIYSEIQTWQKSWNCSINYFFCSAFGMKGNPPRPNVQLRSQGTNGISATIANPAVWQPIGLVAPLYWLHTGHDDPRLRDY